MFFVGKLVKTPFLGLRNRLWRCGYTLKIPDQLEEEFKECLDLAKYMLDTVGLLDDCTFRFSQWDPANPKNKYEGTAEQWEKAQAAMGRILDDLGVKYDIGIDEAAFYGPKLDIQYKNVFGKEDTLVTIQIDMLLAEKYGMEYVDKDGSRTIPYIIHRTSLGCYERTLAYLIEKYAGWLPLWMADEQVRILPISDAHYDYAYEVCNALKRKGIRATVDDRSEKLGKKIREATLEKVIYTAVIGDQEVADKTVAVSSRFDGKLGTKNVDELADIMLKEINDKVRHNV